MANVPYRNHIIVHLFELLLRGIKGVGRWVEFVRFEALFGELDLEGLVIFL